MSESKWPRIKWNQACSELANRPFIDLFKESDSMKNDPTSSAVMDYELMRQRAEAAEARAADAEIRAKSWHDSSMTLADQRDAAYKRNAELEADNDEMQGYINEIRVALHTEKDELTIDAVRRVISERDELARKLAEIKSILAGGRTVGGDVEQAYRDAEEIAEDGANAHKAMIQ